MKNGYRHKRDIEVLKSNFGRSPNKEIARLWPGGHPFFLNKSAWKYIKRSSKDAEIFVNRQNRKQEILNNKGKHA